VSTTWALDEGDEIVPGRHALRLLGGGRRHEAYLAWDDRLHAVVVAKVLRPDYADDTGPLAAEAELLRELAHPLVLRTFGAVLDGPRPHLVLEHIEGPRLSTLIRRYGLSLEQLLPLGLEIARLLRYLGAEGVVHLDIKPGNVIMDGRPRLIDLSVACRRERLGDLTSPVGTDPYMAPEQCDVARFGALGPPTDVWGLGATLYEALAGVPPFPPDGERFPQLRRRPAPLGKRVPRTVAELVLACMARESHDRPAAGQVETSLQELVAALPSPRISRLRRRRA
jgi:eukaryotic-like serine/threonine-protein kinase